MTPAVFAIPGDIDLPTGGYTYDRRVLTLLPHHGVDVCHLRLPDGFPSPGPGDLTEASRLLAEVAHGTVTIVDGLAYGATPVAYLEPVASPIVALVHHPLCLEAGLSEERQAELRALETAALARARHVVVTSPLTARTLAADFAVPPGRITVAMPGTDPAPRARGTGAPLQILAVGSIVPRKAYDVLVRALVPLASRDWRLTIAGAIDRSPPTVEALREAVRESGLAERITLAGPLGTRELDSLYAAADLFVLPSLYEGYGMVLAEAMARGLPIVCTTGGAAAETVPDRAAIKVPPGAVEPLTEAIARVLDDTELRRRMSDASWTAGQALPRWDDTARIIADVVKELARERL